MTETERLTILYGDPALAPPERIPLRAGPLSLVYTTDGDLRYVKWGGHEIMRRLYAAVRDENWGTVQATITEAERRIGENSFRIAYDAHYTDEPKGIDFLARVTLTSDTDGAVTFDFDGEARSSFSRNRIGICALHPAQDCKGKPCVVRHTDGSEENGAFPALIAPHQPFLDIAAITHEVAPGVSATVTFAGDVFEMEDQRNWLDASFKTYSTPLALPYPVEVAAGTRIRQTVTLMLNGAAVSSPPPREDNEPVVCTVRKQMGKAPGYLGLSLPTDPIACKAEQDTSALLRALHVDHLLAKVDATREDWLQTLAAADKEVEEGYDKYTSLHVALHSANHLTARLPYNLKHGCIWTIFPSDAATFRHVFWECVLDSLSFFQCGSSTNFTELNHNRPGSDLLETGLLEGVVFAGNPQVHAFDCLSIMETPPMIAEALQTARSFVYQDIPLHTGPLTLYGPFNNDDDPRHRALFGAAWYMAALSYAMQGPHQTVTHITLCETTGLRGVVAEDGAPYPVYHALAALGAVSTGPLEDTLTTTVSHPLSVACLAVREGNAAHLFVVNLTPDPQSVHVNGLDAACSSTIRVLDENNALVGFSEPRAVVTSDGVVMLSLRAYAIAELKTQWRDIDA